MDKKTPSSAPTKDSRNTKGRPGGRINYGERRRRSKPAVSSRLIVLDLMAEIIGKGHPLQDAVNTHKDWGKLEDRDRRFARRLITIVLRYRRLARNILNRYLQKPINRKDRKAEAVLILAIVELVWADGDSYAVVDQAVRMMRGKGFTHMTGLANAVLRKVSKDQDTLKNEVFNPLDTAPAWLRDHLENDWGDEAQTIMASFLKEPSLDFSCVRDPDDWAKRLDGALLAHGTVRRRDGMVTALDGYDDGQWWVQDAAAAVPAQLLKAACGEMAGKHIIDLCAAPGGKTAQLIAMGADVTALDQSGARMKTFSGNMKRLQMTPETIVADGTAWTPSEKVDAVLLDAPCSATGTLRRRPDILSHENAPDLKGLNTIQRDLFAAAAAWLKPGGILIYATCSILKTEGEAIVADLPAGLTPSPIDQGEIDGMSLTLNEHGHARIMPDAVDIAAAKIIPEDMDSTDDIPQGNDGFFIARFIKS